MPKKLMIRFSDRLREEPNYKLMVFIYIRAYRVIFLLVIFHRVREHEIRSQVIQL